MLTVRDGLPNGLLERAAHELHEILPGPTLLHLRGRRSPALFVSVLLHGDETTGWEAIRTVLKEQPELPRALSLFIGNVHAARDGYRLLPGQSDYNRIWDNAATLTPEHTMARAVIDTMRERGVFASVDVHNNSGLNPHYGCVRRLDARFLQLATLFSRTVVYFTKPDGVQAEAFASLCPAVTIECGQAGVPAGTRHVVEYLHACLQLAEIPSHPVADHDIDLYHSVGIVKIPHDVSFGFDDSEADMQLLGDLDRLNFRELPSDTLLGRVRPNSRARLEVWDERGYDVTERFVRITNGELRTTRPVMPSMFTCNARAVRDDCLGYLMERPENSRPT